MNIHKNKLSFSLQRMCATVTIGQLVHCSNRPARIALNRCEHYIGALNNSMPLPTAFKNLFRSLWKPVVRDLGTFQRLTLHFPIKPVRNPQGHVNVMDSTRQFLLDKNVHRVLRFIIACRFCYENHIDSLGQQLTKEEICMMKCHYDIDTTPFGAPGRIHCPMTRFWLIYCRNRAGVMEIGRIMEFQAYNGGFQIALDNHLEAAIRFFLYRANDVTMYFFLGQRYREVSKEAESLSYETRCKLFQLSLSQDYFERNAYLFSLLHDFLTWPYQSCFLVAAQKHLHEINEVVFRALLVAIAHEAKFGDQDHDYGELFHEFGQLCSHISNGFSQARTEIVKRLLNDFDFDSNDDLVEFVIRPSRFLARVLEMDLYGFDFANLPRSIQMRRKLRTLVSHR